MPLTAALSLLLLSQATAQHPPDLERLQAALDAAYAKRPSLQVLRALKQGPVATSLEEDLASHDWLVAGAWSWADRNASEYTRAREENPYVWLRYLPDGSERRCRWDPDAGAIRQDHAGPVVKVERRRGRTWLVLVHPAEGERQYLRVVSYARGVLVLDVTRGGTPASRDVEFRTVQVAMPRPSESGGP